MLGILSALIKPVFNVIDKVVVDKDLREKLKHEIATQDFKMAQQELEARAKIIATEAKSEHWIVAAWRPITALVMVAIVFNNYILWPYLHLFWPSAPLLETPPELWNTIKICLGGYIVSRGVEKGIEKWKKVG